jgi:aminoglycoside phosphotransferase (APT) family kinase protein
MPEWTAEVAVDERLARELIDEQFPELAAGSVALLSAGWDNTVWLVDGSWAFRFPRREIAVPLVERELAVLPQIAPLLTAPVPVPTFHGKPTGSYPWPFTGSRFLRGTDVGSAVLTSDAEIAIAEALGRFLRALHAPELVASASQAYALPHDPNGRADMARRVPRTHEAFERLEAAGLWHAPASLETLLEDAGLLDDAPASALVHGDLHFLHLLVEAGELTGVIDWGDVCLADPSVDLQLLWSFFSPPAREAFLREYGPVPDERMLRARVFALSISALLALYGHDESRPEITRPALAGLDRACAG